MLVLHNQTGELLYAVEQLVPGAVLVVHDLLQVVLTPPVLAEPHELGQVGGVLGSGQGQMTLCSAGENSWTISSLVRGSWLDTS